MDTTALQSQVDSLTSSIATDETTLQNDQAELAKLQAELKVASLVNQLEALTADEITALNSLLTEPENTLGVSLAVAIVPVAAAEE
jgi:hypothetical protein